VRFCFIHAEKANYPIKLMCSCLSVSRSGYYAWRGRGPSARSQEDESLKVKISASHRASRGTYGSPRIRRDLMDDGEPVARKRVDRLMRELEIEGVQKRGFRATTDSRHGLPVAPNLLMREFDVDAPNTAWVTDITYISTLDGWLYLAAILDLCSRRVIGYAMSDRIDRRLAIDAVRQALRLRPDVQDLLHHSDQGSTYASHDYQQALEQAGITCSMSRRGNCWDNAVAESFFATLKKELLYRRPLRPRSTTRAEVADYIDSFYNVRRRHSSLGYLSPLEFELRHPGNSGYASIPGVRGKQEAVQEIPATAA
jgi:putative transposase